MGDSATRIAEVKHAGEYRLRVRFARGEALTVDLRELVHRLKGLRPLRDIAVFACASIGEGGHSVAWPGELDVGADRLFELALEQKG